jgi:hypothetical protein
VSKLTDQWIEIFRAGNYGDKGEYSERDLDQIVANYNPAFHEAPAVIGHPENDKPAWGWVEALKRVGDTLFGKLKQVEPAFEEMVDKGRFKKRSIGLYQTDKGLALRHVGFLGAKSPEIKGLADVRFNDQGKQVIEFTEEDLQVAGEEKTFMDQLKAFWAGRESVTVPPGAAAEKTFSEADVKRFIEEATKPLGEKIAKVEADAKAQATTFAEREKVLQSERLGAAATSAIATLKANGNWVPAFDKMLVPQFFSELAKSPVSIEFSEGDNKINRSLLETAVSIFSALGKIVPGGTLVQASQARQSSFSENPGGRATADPNSIRLNDLATSRQKEKKISFSEAISEVVSEHPELAAPGGIAAGKV